MENVIEAIQKELEKANSVCQLEGVPLELKLQRNRGTQLQLDRTQRPFEAYVIQSSWVGMPDRTRGNFCLARSDDPVPSNMIGILHEKVREWMAMAKRFQAIDFPKKP